jgi:hypothetical protein
MTNIPAVLPVLYSTPPFIVGERDRQARMNYQRVFLFLFIF